MFPPDRPTPPGCCPPSEEERMPVVKVVSGDSCRISVELYAPDGGPASPKNCCIEFVLSENQFSPPLWTGTWGAGAMPSTTRPGLVHIDLPPSVSASLRRGSYMFSVRVGDLMNWEYRTQAEGYLLVEYAPTSDQRSIPYRDGTSEIFASNSSNASNDGEEGVA